MQQRWWIALVAAVGIGLAILWFPHPNTGAKPGGSPTVEEPEPSARPVAESRSGAGIPVAPLPAPDPITEEEREARNEELRDRVQQVRTGAAGRSRSGRAAPDPSSAPEDDDATE